MTHQAMDVVLVFDVCVRTRNLSLNLISEERLGRHSLIEQLRDEGLDDKEIAQFLNLCGVKTPTGLSYYQELVFVTRRKIRMRNERTREKIVEIGKLNFYIS